MFHKCHCFIYRITPAQNHYFWPMFFKDVVGQEKIKQRLIRSVKEQRISHAQMFTGPEGTGKLALAIAFAQYISCRNRGENDSCGECPSCRKYSKACTSRFAFCFPCVSLKSGHLSLFPMIFFPNGGRWY
jgi:hypothetical protein